MTDRLCAQMCGKMFRFLISKRPFARCGEFTLLNVGLEATSASIPAIFAAVENAAGAFEVTFVHTFVQISKLCVRIK